MINEGWLCPKCKKINAPWVKECDCNDQNTVSSITGGSSSTVISGSYISSVRMCDSNCEFFDDSCVLTSNPPRYRCTIDGESHFRHDKCKFADWYVSRQLMLRNKSV